MWPSERQLNQLYRGLSPAEPKEAGQTSGFKSRTVDRFQRTMGWVVPGFRERLVDFYAAVKNMSVPNNKIFDKDADDSFAKNPSVVSAWNELAQYFHAHQDRLLELYPGMHENWLNDTNKYVIPLKESELDDSLHLSKRHSLALSAWENIGARSGRGWANNKLKDWAPRKKKERAYASSPALPDNGIHERMLRQDMQDMLPLKKK